MHEYETAELAARPLWFAVHGVLDFAVCAVLAFLALRGGLAGARRLGVGHSLSGAAAVASPLLTLAMVPGLVLRGADHQLLDARVVPLVAGGWAESEAAAPFARDVSSFCSFSREAPQSPVDAPSAAAPALLLEATRGALMDLAAALPLLALGLTLARPRRSLRATLLRAGSCLGARVTHWPAPARRAALATGAVPLVVLLGFAVSGAYRPSRSYTDPCRFGADRSFDVSAIHVSITLNRFGDRDPNAYMYVLDERIPDVRAEEAESLPDRVSTGLRGDAIQPLVLRANLGECVAIRFTNRLSDGPASLHLHGLSHAAESAGSSVGLNPDTFASPGASITYTIPLPSDETVERAYYFHDHGASRQRVAHGLFGALVAEPAGSRYYDPETGAPLAGGSWEAVVAPPGQPAFREFAIFYHEVGDENFDGLVDATGATIPVVDEISDTYRPAGRALNYRSEPFDNRLELEKDKSQGYGSYMFGDPATPIPRSYLGEPTKTRLLHGGSEVFHVHHLHGGADRWRRNPKADPGNDISSGLSKRPVQNVFSTHLDSQSIGPGTSFNLEHECGAGGCQQAAGDFLYHCHIGHHYPAGMWGFWRVFDTLQDDLAPLPDRAPPAGAVTSVELAGLEVEGMTLVPEALLTDPTTQRSLEAFIEAQLAPQGQRLHSQDATVWDWQKVDTAAGPLYLGEPETTAVWANYASPTPGERPAIRFNPENGRYAWPLFTPHLGQRPPFAPNGHSGAPWLGEDGSALRPDGLCPNTDVVPELTDQTRRQYPISAITLPIQITPAETDDFGMIFALGDEKDAILAGTKPRTPLAIRSNVGDRVDVLLVNEISGPSPENSKKVNIHTADRHLRAHGLPARGRRRRHGRPARGLPLLQQHRPRQSAPTATTRTRSSARHSG